MKFLLLHYADESAEWSAEETKEDQALLAAWLEDTIARGVNVQGSYLQPSQTAATIRARDGELLLTDGPFAETKEQIAGFDIIECADLREAIEVASAHPTTRHGTIEVRPFPPDLADGGAEQVPDAVSEGQADRSADDDTQDGAADIAAPRRALRVPVRPRAIRTATNVTGTRRPAGGSRMASIGSTAPDVNDSADAPAA